MFEGINRWLSKKQVSEMADKKPDEPNQSRIKNPNLKDWMGEASAVGLDGEVGNGKEFNILVGDLKNQPDMTVVGIPDRHGLHLVTPEESGGDIEDLMSEIPAANSAIEAGAEVEIIGKTEIFDPIENALLDELEALEAKAAIVRVKLLKIQAARDVKEARDRVKEVAA